MPLPSVGVVNAVRVGTSPSARRVARIWKLAPTGLPSGPSTWANRFTLGGQVSTSGAVWGKGMIFASDSAGALASAGGAAWTWYPPSRSDNVETPPSATTERASVQDVPVLRT